MNTPGEPQKGDRDAVPAAALDGIGKAAVVPASLPSPRRVSRSHTLIGIRAVNIATALLIVSLTVGVPGRVVSGMAAAGACPAQSVCDSRLGIEVPLPHRWVRLSGVPVSEIDLARPGAGTSGYIRLVIRAYAVTSDPGGNRAIVAAAGQLTAEYPGHGAVSRRGVTYGGAHGLLLRGLPPTPQAAADILLAHGGAVYLVIAPGSQLAPDQRRALAGLRFIPRVGSFPVQPHLSVRPNPVKLGQRLQITLTGAQPGLSYAFAVQPGRPGFGGGNMGRRQTNVTGVVTFTYAPFRDRRDTGQWTMAVYNWKGQRVARTVVIVTATAPSRPRNTGDSEA